MTKSFCFTSVMQSYCSIYETALIGNTETISHLFRKIEYVADYSL